MTPQQKTLDRQIALATGERISTIRRLGFSIADPPLVAFDPEPTDSTLDNLGMIDSEDESFDAGPHVIDWDERDAQRMSIFPADYRRRAA